MLPVRELFPIRSILATSIALSCMGHVENVQALDSMPASVITYQTFQFSTDLSAVNSKEWLVNQLVYAQLLHRADITDATLQRLFAISPNNLQGLKYQALYLSASKHIDKAQELLKKMQSQAPDARETKQLASYLSIYSTNRSDYQQAQLMSRSGRNVEALKIYDKIFPDGMPTPSMKLEYLLLEDKDSDNWQKVQDGLVQLNKDYPGVPDFQLAWATHTLNDDPSDAAGLEMVQQLTLNPTTSGTAAQLWLSSLNDNYITKDVVKQYAILSGYMPGNQEFVNAYADAKKRLIKETELRKDPTYMAKLDGLALVDADRYVAAEPKLVTALSTRPHDTEILGGLGFVYMKTGRQTLAVEYFKKAKQYDPDKRYTDKWNSLIAASAYWANLDEGDRFMKKGQYAQAKKQYQASVTLKPENPYAYNSLAELALAQKQYSQADKHYLMALKQEPLNETALRGRMDIRVEQKGDMAAYKFAQGYTPAQRRIVQDKISGLYSAALLADVHQALAVGDNYVATIKLNELLKNPPTSPWDRADIADALQTTGDPVRANQLMKQWSQNKDPETQFAYALYLSRHGQTDQAINVLQGIPAKQRSQSVQNNLVRLKVDLAFEQLSALMQTDPDAAKGKIDQMLAEYQGQPQAEVRLIEMEYKLGFEGDSREDASKLTPQPTWPYQTQLDYGNLLFSLKSYDEFDHWKNKLGEPSGTVDEVADYRQQRDMLFAQYAMFNQDYGTAEGLYLPIATGNSDDAVTAQFALIEAYRADGNKAAAQEMTQRAYQNRQNLNGYQTSELSGLLNEQGQTEQALELSRQTLTKSDAGASDLRTSMNVAMDNHDYKLAKSLGYRALLSDQMANQDQAVSEPQQKDLRQLYDEAGDNWLTRGVKSDIDTINNRNDGYIEFGIDYSGRDNENTAVQIPVEISIPMPEYDGHLLIRTDMVSLDSGDLAYFNKDTGSDSDTTFNSKSKGVEFGVGWQAKTWSADIGTTPIGFDSQTWVGGLNLSGDLGDFGWKSTFSRRSETSSTLSFGGMEVPTLTPKDGENRLKEDSTHAGEHWGNVMSTGVKLGGSYDVGGPVGYWSSLQYHFMDGQNVEDNTRLGLLGGTYWKIISDTDKHLSLGLNGMYLHYDKNLSEYAYGYGGYYSPQQYFSLSLPVNWYQRLGNDFSYILRGSVSNSWSQEDPLYGAAGEKESGGGFGYSLEAAMEKRVSKRWYIGLAVDIQRSDFYEPNHGLLYARYTFTDRWQPVEMPVNPLTLYADFD
ncbi:hypothetical protein A1QC_06510 [Vibrio rumoiensis 1S-45]|uniref:Cellulose synthase operon C C-terminal domain-containing protein n=2 Tax=Vibrio rumoiensis TaxID=76258 RepID=A0A1E5E462_9VIBR|nr:hypothetical protein A1QC_06510 [Vibrio rumoiensis 1S-45]